MKIYNNKKVALVGYTEGKTDLQKNRIEKVLIDKLYRRNGNIITYAECTLLRVFEEGCTPEVVENYSYYSSKLEGYTKPKTIYRFSNDEENYIYDITKIEYDFANYVINNFDNIEIALEEENNRLIQIQKDLEEKKRIEQVKQLQEEQEKENYKKWLELEVENYNNIELVEFVKNIYMDRLNNYNVVAIKKLLVLIDNIDNKLCRDDLINWLHNSNTTTIKAFYHITGIKLEKNYSDRIEQIKSIRKSNFKGIIDYAPATIKEERELQEFKIRKGNIIEVVKGEKLENDFGLNTFIFKDDNGKYSITEGKTGIAIINNIGNKSEIIKSFKDRLTKDDMITKLKAEIEKLMVNKYNNESLN